MVRRPWVAPKTCTWSRRAIKLAQAISRWPSWASFQPGQARSRTAPGQRYERDLERLPRYKRPVERRLPDRANRRRSCTARDASGASGRRVECASMISPAPRQGLPPGLATPNLNPILTPSRTPPSPLPCSSTSSKGKEGFQKPAQGSPRRIHGGSLLDASSPDLHRLQRPGLAPVSAHRQLAWGAPPRPLHAAGHACHEDLAEAHRIAARCVAQDASH
eukprot:6841297-Prymnesium_polylepis.1